MDLSSIQPYHNKVASPFYKLYLPRKKKLGTPSNLCESAIKVLLKKELIVQAKMLPGHSDI